MNYKGNEINVVLLQDKRFNELAKKKGIEFEIEAQEIKLNMLTTIGTNLKCFMYKHFNNSKKSYIYTYEFIESNSDGFGGYAFQTMNEMSNPIELYDQYMKEVNETLSINHKRGTYKRNAYDDFISNPNSSIEN